MQATKTKTISKRSAVGRPALRGSVICENEIPGPESIGCWGRKQQKRNSVPFKMLPPTSSWFSTQNDLSALHGGCQRANRVIANEEENKPSSHSVCFRSTSKCTCDIVVCAAQLCYQDPSVSWEFSLNFQHMCSCVCVCVCILKDKACTEKDTFSIITGPTSHRLCFNILAL